MRVLAATGNALTLPCVSLGDHGGATLRLTLTHVVGGRKRTEKYEFTRDELWLIAQAVLEARVWPED